MSGDAPTPGGLTISSALDGATARVRLEGELDLASAEQMEERMVEVDAGRPERVVIDLGGLTFIDSTGLRLLLQADTRAQERGYELLLRPGAPAVQRVFEVTGALDVLRFESP